MHVSMSNVRSSKPVEQSNQGPRNTEDPKNEPSMRQFEKREKGRERKEKRSLTKKRNPEENPRIMCHTSLRDKYHVEKEAETVPIDLKNLAR